MGGGVGNNGGVSSIFSRDYSQQVLGEPIAHLCRPMDLLPEEIILFQISLSAMKQEGSDSI